MMIKKQLHTLLITFLMLFNSPVLADNLFIIVAKDSYIKAITTQQLKRIFRRKTRIDPQGRLLIPINIGVNNPLRIAFTKTLFNQLPEEMAYFWNIQYFNGINPPYVVSSEEALLRFISSTPGAIGYINACYLDSRVQVILKLSSKENINRYCPSK